MYRKPYITDFLEACYSCHTRLLLDQSEASVTAEFSVAGHQEVELDVGDFSFRHPPQQITQHGIILVLASIQKTCPIGNIGETIQVHRQIRQSTAQKLVFSQYVIWK